MCTKETIMIKILNFPPNILIFPMNAVPKFSRFSYLLCISACITFAEFSGLLCSHIFMQALLLFSIPDQQGFKYQVWHKIFHMVFKIVISFVLKLSVTSEAPIDIVVLHVPFCNLELVTRYWKSHGETYTTCDDSVFRLQQ